MEIAKEVEKKYLVSIIIATYNAERYIHACLASIRYHMALPLEVIIVDGGSSDRTCERIAEFSELEIRYLSEDDKGIYDAFNKGIDLASGRWLYFLGADDRLLPGFSELAAKLDNENTVYYGNSKPFFENENMNTYGLLQGEFNAYRLAKYCMNHQSIIYPAKAFSKFKYDLKYKVLADYAFNIRLWGDRNFVKRFYPIDVVSYNMGGFSTVNEDVNFERDKLKLIRKGMGIKLVIRLLFRALKDRLRNEKP